MGEVKCAWGVCLFCGLSVESKNACFLNPWVSSSNVVESCGSKFECNARSECLGPMCLFVVIAGRRGGVGACRRWFGGLPRSAC
jgi:hypothetical protein